MEIEYSNEVRGKVFAYRFYDNEMKAIAKCLPSAIKKLEKQIKRIEDNPKNEGQATYSCQIDDLRSQINDLKGIIKEFE